MTKKYPYNGSLIDVRTYSLDGGNWTALFAIEKCQEFDILATLFQIERRFPTREAALGAAILAATQRIGAGAPPLAFGSSRVGV
jgi:hypothetical protein